MKIGIYCITNKVNGKMYIGQSKDVKRRISRHEYDLLSNRHINKHLQNSWNKHGSSNFEFKLLEELDTVEQLSGREIEFIKRYNTASDGYNLTPGGESGYTSFLGRKHTKESRSKMRAKRKNQVITKEHKKNISEALKGGKRVPFTKEQRAKMSASHTGKTLSREHIESLRLARLGTRLSEETKRKISEKHKGKKLSEETKSRISNSKRIAFTEEQVKEIKERMSSGESSRSICKDFNCSHATINRRFKKQEVIYNDKNDTQQHG